MDSMTQRGQKLYRLELSEDGPLRAIEFAADGPESLLRAAERYVDGGGVTIFEDGRQLACLRKARNHGFWTIAPGPSVAA